MGRCPMSPLGSMNLNCRDRSARVRAPSAATVQPRLGAADVGLVHLYGWPAYQGLARARDVRAPIGAARCSMAQAVSVGDDPNKSSLQAQRRASASVYTVANSQQVAAGISHQGCPPTDTHIEPLPSTSCVFRFNRRRLPQPRHGVLSRARAGFVAATRTADAVSRISLPADGRGSCPPSPPKRFEGIPRAWNAPTEQTGRSACQREPIHHALGVCVRTPVKGIPPTIA